MVSVITPPIISVVHILCPFFVNNEVYAYFSFFRLTLKYQKLSDYCHRQPSIAFLSSLFIHCIHSKLKWLSANATTRYVIFCSCICDCEISKSFPGTSFTWILHDLGPWPFSFYVLSELCFCSRSSALLKVIFNFDFLKSFSREVRYMIHIDATILHFLRNISS